MAMLDVKIFMGKESDDSVVKSYLTTAADGWRTRRIWRNCGASKMRRNDAARMENTDKE